MRIQQYAVIAIAALFGLSACQSDRGQAKNGQEKVAQTDVSKSAGEAPDETDLEDPDITTAVVTQLLTAREAPARDITVQTNQGIVRLNGTVDAIAHKERAVRVASQVKGVRGVVDNIEVDAPDVPDAKLISDVKLALADDPATESFQVKVAAQEGDVVLSGEVDSYAEAQLAETVTESVRGVESVTNNIDITFAEERSDDQIQKEIRRRIAWDARVDATDITIDVKEGKVTLDGRVDSFYAKSLAQSLAWVRGVEQVEAESLEIQWWKRNELADASVLQTRSDEKVAEAVRDALLYDPRVMSFETNVLVDDGEVTLTGSVNNLRARQAAEETAMNVHGVWEVNNLLEVDTAFEEFVDATIEEAIERRLTTNSITDGFEIGVAVEDGAVTLTGNVETALEGRTALEIAATTPGVATVDNNIIISAPNLAGQDEVTDQVLEQRIADQLFWSPAIDAEAVNVEVKNGAAILSGTVQTFNERRNAIENAREAGAETVDATELMVAFGPAKLVPEGGIAR